MTICTWLWNIRHRRLIRETRNLIFLSLFLRHEAGLQEDLSINELKQALRILEGR